MARRYRKKKGYFKKGGYRGSTSDTFYGALSAKQRKEAIDGLTAPLDPGATTAATVNTLNGRLRKYAIAKEGHKAIKKMRNLVEWASYYGGTDLRPFHARNNVAQPATDFFSFA